MLNFPEILKTHCIALTGGIATGKSFIRSLLERDFNAICFDADQLARQVFDQDRGLHQEVVDAFGDAALTDQGQLNRGFIRQEIMNNETKRQKLNSITHPRIRARLEQLIEDHITQIRHAGFFVYEASLIVETGRSHEFREVWMSVCSRKTQCARLEKRDLDKNPHERTNSWVEKAISAQLPPTSKALYASRLFSTEPSPVPLENLLRRAILSLPKTS